MRFQVSVKKHPRIISRNQKFITNCSYVCSRIIVGKFFFTFVCAFSSFFEFPTTYFFQNTQTMFHSNKMISNIFFEIFIVSQFHFKILKLLTKIISQQLFIYFLKYKIQIFIIWFLRRI